MRKGKESIGYVSGEPEGLGRRESEELKEEETRLAGGKKQAELRRKKEAMEKAKERPARFAGGKEEISLGDAAEEDLVSGELNPEQALELKQAIRHGFADITQNPKGEVIEPEPARSLDDLKKITEEKERGLRGKRQKK